uniref:Organic solute transporter alpha-like protein n=1 Tax=Panagrellus redivivus TaxID=6233 RepID=A0A7E4USK3_PANRE
MLSFNELVTRILALIRTLLIPGTVSANCTRIETDDGDPNAYQHDQPTAKFFLTHLSKIQLTFLIAGSFATTALIALGLAHAKSIVNFVSNKTQRKLLLIQAFLFPASAALCLTGMFIPRSATINASLGLFVFLVAIAACIRLCRTLCSGWPQLAAELESRGKRISLMNPPFCCIIPCMPSLSPVEKNLRYLELAVLQAPFVRGFVVVTQVVAIAEYREGAAFWLQVCDVATLVSLLMLVFGFHTLSRAAGEILTDYAYTSLFRIVDLGLLFFSAQEPLIFENIFVRFGAIGCSPTLNPHDNARFICNFLIIMQFCVLSTFASHLLRPQRSALFDRHPVNYSPCPLTEADGISQTCTNSTATSDRVLLAP